MSSINYDELMSHAAEILTVKIVKIILVRVGHVAHIFHCRRLRFFALDDRGNLVYVLLG
jgi:hypothetical protein